MPIDPSELTKSIGAIGTLDPEQGLAPILQQIVVAAKQLFEADAAGLMLIDAQERLAQGPCMVAFSQRARRRSATSATNPSGGSWGGCWPGKGSVRR